MLQVNFQQLQEVLKNSVNLSGLREISAEDFQTYQQRIISRGQGFLELPNQSPNVENIKSFSEEVREKYEDIVVIGIGGSMLGPQTIQQALDVMSTRWERGVKFRVHFVDNSDPFVTQEVASQVNLEKTLFLVQTKSGSTPETLAQYFYFRQWVDNLYLPAKEHFVFVTDPEDGYLRQVAQEEGIPSFPIPSNVGGRFSVLSSVGLLLAGLLNLDIEHLLAGAKAVVNTYFYGTESLEDGSYGLKLAEGWWVDRSAYELASMQWSLYKQGVNMTVLMPYSNRLQTLAKWYTQLLSESIGKKYNLEKKVTHTGITPVPALGATDQHSQLQLFQEGPTDKLIMFVEVQNHQSQRYLPEEYTNLEKFNFLQNRSLEDLIQAELQGTRQSLTESEKPNVTLSIPRVDEYSLGGMFMFLELSVAFLGEFLNINTFDQPGVERSKILTKKILKS
jgi:glucose-6-phosphate isomerase